MSTSNVQDAAILHKQYRLLTKCCEIDQTYFLARAEIQLHTCRYFCKALVFKTDSFIEDTARNHHDRHGRMNYVQAFLMIIDSNLIYIENLNQCQKIALQTIKRQPDLTKRVGANALGVSEGVEGGEVGEGGTQVKNTVPNTGVKCCYCNGNHRTLLQCIKLVNFIPVQGKNITLPLKLCNICLFTSLSTSPPQCHTSNTKFPVSKAICQDSKINKLLCSASGCDNGELQEWFRKFFNKEQGTKNYILYGKRTKTKGNQITSNAIRLNVNKIGMTINDANIGETACMSEMLSVRLDDNTFQKVKLFYDSQSQHTMCNPAVHKLVVEQWHTGNPLQICTIFGTSTKKRTLCKLKLTEELSIQSIMIDSLQVDSYRMNIPSQWGQMYADQWCEEITDKHDIIDATILIGTDLPLLYPMNVLNAAGLPVQTTTALLMKSRISHKLMAFGHNRQNITHNIKSMVTGIEEEEEGEEVHPINITTSSEQDEPFDPIQIAEVYSPPIQPNVNSDTADHVRPLQAKHYIESADSIQPHPIQLFKK